MYEYGSARKPIVIREVRLTVRDGVEHNTLIIPERLFRMIDCPRSSCRRIYVVIIPTLLTDDQRPLTVSHDGVTEFHEIYRAGEHVNATTDRLQPYAGTRKMVSFQLGTDEHYNRAWILEAVHTPCGIC